MAGTAAGAAKRWALHPGGTKKQYKPRQPAKLLPEVQRSLLEYPDKFTAAQLALRLQTTEGSIEGALNLLEKEGELISMSLNNKLSIYKDYKEE